MFRCVVGGHLSEPGERRHMVVTEVRQTVNVHGGDREVPGRETHKEVACCEAHLAAAPPPRVVGVRRILHRGETAPAWAADDSAVRKFNRPQRKF